MVYIQNINKPAPTNQLTLIAEQVFEYLRWVGAGFLVLGFDDINLGEPAPTNILIPNFQFPISNSQLPLNASRIESIPQPIPQ
ncbi:hypothetical protein C7B67_10215 [filamentous cyanobacterium Phorm 6]|nr:hypothetical protein C7B67_10215 [filamentous cyanobacterium Phorm 6]